MTMQNQFIVTPYFLDNPLPRLEALADNTGVLNKPQLPKAETQYRMSKLHEPLANHVVRALETGRRPVSIAGDCCSTIGVLAGLQRAGIEPFLIWFDAHGDFNTWETTPSGFLGGMPLAMLVGKGEQTMPNAVGLESIAEDRVILTDARDLDPGEREAVARSDLRHLSDVRQLLDYPLPDLPLYVHFDTDVVDPIDAPAMNYPAPDGPRASELEAVFRHIAQRKRIVAASMSSWSPKLDKNQQSERHCMKLLRTLVECCA